MVPIFVAATFLAEMFLAETTEEIHEGYSSVIVVALFILAAMGVLIWWLRR